MVAKIKLEASWMAQIGEEFDTPYMASLKAFLREEKRLGKEIYPSADEVFKALNTTAFEKVRVVILGQDPYHGPGQAHGLSFSVPPGVRVPPSLANIFKEIQREMDAPIPSHGCLLSWAQQGVLLLNATLTVEQGKAGSHQRRGWEEFTDAVIHALNDKRDGLVFLLWGSYAQKKGVFIDQQKHAVLRSPHPSPLSAHRGFMGNGHFLKANEILASKKMTPIDWSLPEIAS